MDGWRQAEGRTLGSVYSSELSYGGLKGPAAQGGGDGAAPGL